MREWIKKKAGEVSIIAGILVVIFLIGVVTGGGYDRVRRAIGLRPARAADECSEAGEDCGECKVCKDKYPDKPFEVLKCTKICSDDRCIDDSCCAEEKVCEGGNKCCGAGKWCVDDECVSCNPDDRPTKCHDCESGSWEDNRPTQCHECKNESWEWKCPEVKGDCEKRVGCSGGECDYDPSHDCCPDGHYCVPKSVE